MTHVLLLIFSLCLLIGCARPLGGPKQPAEAPPERPQPIEEPSTIPQNEDFDPLSLNDDEINFSGFSDTAATATESPASPSGSRQTSGFRVQIFAGADEQSARMVEEEARGEFDARVYLSYDPPNYKVRLGDFSERNEADKIRQDAYRKGYRDAWVVPDQIWVEPRVAADTTNIVPDTLRTPEELPETQEPTPQ